MDPGILPRRVAPPCVDDCWSAWDLDLETAQSKWTRKRLNLASGRGSFVHPGEIYRRDRRGGTRGKSGKGINTKSRSHKGQKEINILSQRREARKARDLLPSLTFDRRRSTSCHSCHRHRTTLSCEHESRSVPMPSRFSGRRTKPGHRSCALSPRTGTEEVYTLNEFLSPGCCADR
jgi:hypothetical protein